MRFFYFLILLLTLSTSALSSFERKERVRTEIDRSSLRVYNYDIYANCCAQYLSDVQIGKDYITITQSDTSTARCKCSCYMDMEYRLNSIRPGKYFLKIIRSEHRKNGYSSDTSYVIHTERIDIRSTYTYAPFLFSYYQTDCKSGSESDDKYLLPNNDILVYPNPTSGSATLRYRINQDADVSITLYNLLGKEVLSIPKSRQTAGVRSMILDLKDLPPGIYIGKVSPSGGKVKSFKIVWSK